MRDLMNSSTDKYRRDPPIVKTIERWQVNPKVHPQFINEMSRGTYEDPLAVFGEYASNSWDSDSLKFVTQIDRSMITFEDWGPGMNRAGLDIFWYFFRPTKMVIDKTELYQRPMVGRKGVGGKAGRNLGNSLEVITRNPDSILQSTLLIKEEDGIVDDIKIDYTEYPILSNYDRKTYGTLLNHIGTKVRISELVSEFEPSKVTEYYANNLYAMMAKGIVTDRPMTFIVNSQKVEPKIPKGQSISPVPFELKISDKQVRDTIRGVLAPAKNTQIDILLRAPKIMSTSSIAIRNPVAGYVIVDTLDVTTQRNSIIKNHKWEAFSKALENYITANFPSKEEYLLKGQEQAMKAMRRLMETIFDEDKFALHGYAQPGTKQLQKPEKDIATDMPALVPTEEPETQKEESGIKKPRTSSPEDDERRRMLDKNRVGKPIRSKRDNIDYVNGNYGNNPEVNIVYGIPILVGFNLDRKLANEAWNFEGKQKLIALAPLYAQAYQLMQRGLRNSDDITDVNELRKFEMDTRDSIGRLWRKLTEYA
jgi:hypothetical protein